MPYSALALGQASLRLRSRRVRSGRSHRLSLRFAVALVLGASLVGFVGGTLRAPTAAGTYTPHAEEQRYLQALWPIHTQLEQSVERLGLLTAVSETQSNDPSELQAQLEASLTSYRHAEDQLRGLDPPPDLRSIHQGYLDALRLLEQSALEMLSTVGAGNDVHPLAVVPVGLEGVSRLHALTDRFWPVRRLG
jgi:hypothetical protein